MRATEDAGGVLEIRYRNACIERATEEDTDTRSKRSRELVEASRKSGEPRTRERGSRRPPVSPTTAKGGHEERTHTRRPANDGEERTRTSLIARKMQGVDAGRHRL